MAGIKELEIALVRADAAGDTASAQALVKEIQALRTTEATRNKAFEQTKGEIADAVTGGPQAALIAAGRAGDKIAEGNRQLGLSANVATREALGMQSGDQLRALAAQEAQQSENDRLYAPLREKYPFSTGLGEAAITMAPPARGMSALGRIAAPAIAFGAQGALEYGSPKERLTKGVGNTAVAGIGGAVGEAGRAIVSPANVTLPVARRQAVEAAANGLGVRPLPSQVTGNSNLALFEDWLARAPGSRGVMQRFDQGNKEAVNQVAAKAIGEDAPALTSEVFSAAKTRLGDEYAALRKSTTMPVLGSVIDAIDGAEKRLSQGLKNAEGKASALSMLGELKDKLYNAKELTGDEFKSVVSDIRSAARSQKNETIASALKDVSRAMDNAAKGASRDKWASVDKQYAALKTLEKPGMVSGTGDVYPVRLGNALERQFGPSWKEGNVSGGLADIGRYGQALPPMRAGSPTAERQAADWRGWVTAIPNWVAAKAMTSDAGRNYLAGGLLGNAAASRGAAGLLSAGLPPLTIAELERLALGY